MATDSDFEALFRTVYPRLVSLGALKTGRADIARELAQETMTRAHARWDEIGEFDAPAAWCRTVMVNLLIDQHRTTAAELRAVDRLAGEPNRAEPPTAALDEWNRMLAPLTGRQRTIVTLHYAEDLSTRQIAQLLDTTRGAVKAALFKARRSMRRHIEETSSDD